MIELTLNSSQTKKFWDTIYDEIDGEMMLIDQYLYEKYTIVKRVWDYRKCLVLTIEDEQYKTWILLTT
jgi:hypothetical protein